MERSSIFRLAGSVVVTAGVLLGPVGANAASHTSGHKSSTPTWVTTKGKVVNLTLIAAYNNTGSGFNFNGAAKGQLTVTVPLGDKVNVTFSNNAALPHSAQVIAYSKNVPSGPVSDAFKGANTANSTSGVTKGTTQKFSFTANKAGNYQIICAVPGHAAAGMWDTLVVSKSAHTASVSLKK
jgi:sulfocyanin